MSDKDWENVSLVNVLPIFFITFIHKELKLQEQYENDLNTTVKIKYY